MKFKIDDKDIFELTDTQKKVLRDEIYDELFDEDMEHRIQQLIMMKYTTCFNKLKTDWLPKLKAKGVKMIPTADDELAELIFSQKDYKNRSQREPIEKSKLRDLVKDKVQ